MYVEPLRKYRKHVHDELTANTTQTPHEIVPSILSKIAPRYANRPGGYTRVLRIEPLKEDQAQSAILELVDSPKDMRFAMTAKTLARLPEEQKFNELTAKNVQKVTRFRSNGMDDLRRLVEKMRVQNEQFDNMQLPEKRKVYPEPKWSREMRYP
jgi:large subunit ribosomal protein L17